MDFFLEHLPSRIDQENGYPMDQSQLLNYVWELLAVDIAKKKRGKKISWTYGQVRLGTPVE